MCLLRIRTGLEKKLDHFDIARAARVEQRRDAVVVGNIGFGSGGEENLHRFDVGSVDGNQQRSGSIP